MQDFKKLNVWAKAHKLTLSVYEVTSRFPREELYGLTQQIRRAANSIPTNIAEGCGRGTPGDFARFLQIVAGSAAEVEYQFLLARDLNYLPEDRYAALDADVCEVKRMLAALLARVQESPDS